MWSSVTMGIGGDSPSSCTDGDRATTLGATLGKEKIINVVRDTSTGHHVFSQLTVIKIY